MQFLTFDVNSLDRNHYFATPVNPETAPGYYELIDKPMHWEKIKQKLDDHEYLNVQDFKVRVLWIVAVDLFLRCNSV